jgi:hypothetical protein
MEDTMYMAYHEAKAIVEHRGIMKPDSIDLALCAIMSIEEMGMRAFAQTLMIGMEPNPIQFGGDA